MELSDYSLQRDQDNKVFSIPNTAGVEYCILYLVSASVPLGTSWNRIGLCIENSRQRPGREV